MKAKCQKCWHFTLEKQTRKTSTTTAACVIVVDVKQTQIKFLLFSGPKWGGVVFVIVVGKFPDILIIEFFLRFVTGLVQKSPCQVPSTVAAATAIQQLKQFQIG